VESVLLRADELAQIFVHGDATREHIVAVGVPVEQALTRWMREEGIEEPVVDTLAAKCIEGSDCDRQAPTTFALACADPRVCDRLLKKLNAQAVDAGIELLSLPRRLYLTSQPFGEDLVTPTLKLRCHALATRFSGWLET